MMTNKELAEQLTTVMAKTFGPRIDVLEEAARRLRELPDPEPEYGWSDLAKSLESHCVYICIGIDCGGEHAEDFLRGTCVRLMREKGRRASYADRAIDNTKGEQFFWCYADCIGVCTNDEMSSGYAPSEPAAYRDMLKHAGVVK